MSTGRAGLSFNPILSYWRDATYGETCNFQKETLTTSGFIAAHYRGYFPDALLLVFFRGTTMQLACSTPAI